MAKLTARGRRALPTKDFAGKRRSYPIEDKGHAQAAIARAKEFHPADEQTIIRKAQAKLGHPHKNLGGYLHPSKGR